ncbi:hypothetical protein [Frondihabitans sp. VKM Ac-2883]|uniref:hypothetical protein n=1 Tax=Frondihabitans sp. VKM Ac-2883 TaxID=2783823 RepID=UPI00188CFDE9|nr:hypothetical protein [Frondihabitans sp. VKM Ac-2883]MBF4576098.1 hypothetical protein [Frondihabitans sp. VKM Ac-2883]
MGLVSEFVLDSSREVESLGAMVVVYLGGGKAESRSGDGVEDVVPDFEVTAKARAEP